MNAQKRLAEIRGKIKDCRDKLINFKGYKGANPEEQKRKMKVVVGLAAEINYLLGYKRCLTDLLCLTSVEDSEKYDKEISNEELGLSEKKIKSEGNN